MWNNKSSTITFQEGLTNKWTYKIKGFSPSDERKIDLETLSPAMQQNIISKLAEYGLTPDDVEIFRDKDIFTDNHYQIRLKKVDNENQEEVKDDFGEA